MLCVLLLLCILRSAVIINGDGLIEVLKWRQLEFSNCSAFDNGSKRLVFPGSASKFGQKQNDLDVGYTQSITGGRDCVDSSGGGATNERFIQYNNVPIGVASYKNFLFVTVPRRREGIPATLNFIDLNEEPNNKSPPLRPFPNYGINQLRGTPENFVSIYRLTIDACERLWFIDTGMLEYPGNFQQIQRPAIWILDLANAKLVRRIEIPLQIALIGRGMTSITVDFPAGDCDKAYGYIPDLINRQLHVYSFATNRFWSFQHASFQPDSLAGNITVNGQNFLWNDGIFSITLGPTLKDGTRNVYYHAMQSNNEFVVSNRVLQQESNAARADHGRDFRLLGSRGLHKQSTMHKYDPITGVLFYNDVNRNAVSCWNTLYEFTPQQQGTVALDDERMIYPSDLTIDNEGTMWVLTNSMPLFVYTRLNPNEYNFRIWKQKTTDAIRNTVCE